MLVAQVRFQRVLCWLLVAAALLGAPGLTAAAPPGPALVEGGSGFNYGGPLLSSCSDNISGAATTSSATLVPLVQCALVVNESGHVLVLANSTAGLADDNDDHYEAEFKLDHNGDMEPDYFTRRRIDSYPDSALLASGDGFDRNIAISKLYTVTAGTHTFTLYYGRTEGTDPVEASSATISALFVPDRTDLRLCGETSEVTYVATENATLFNTVECSLNIPRPGLVFISADGWMSSSGGDPYESANRILMDDNTGGGLGIRYTDVYTNATNGVDGGLSASQVYTVTPGVHEFSLAVRLQSAAGAARLSSPSMVALYVPFDSPFAKACGAVGNPTWSTASLAYSVAATCSLTSLGANWAFMSATAGVGLPVAGSAYEGSFSTAVDGLTPTGGIRYVNSYLDALDGTDSSMATSIVVPVTAGPHVFNLIGRRTSGGTLLARYPMLFVLIPGPSIYLPLVRN